MKIRLITLLILAVLTLQTGCDSLSGAPTEGGPSQRTTETNGGDTLKDVAIKLFPALFEL